MNKFLLIISLALLISTTGCKKDESNVYSAEITNLTDNVIVATYADLDTKAGLLLDAVQELKATTNGTNLTAAQAAWRAARSPWETSEGFLFGPVADKEVDPKIDTWPLDANQLDSILAGSSTLNKAYVDGLDDVLKGFHTIEYLLWDRDGAKTAGDFTARELDYLVACAESLKGQTSILYNGWLSSGDNFAAELKSRGAKYPTEEAVLAELAEGIRGISGEVADSKILEPYTLADETFEESSFSSNSKQDFADNIRSIQNIYLGTYGSLGNSKGLSTIVAAKNSTLDAKIKTQIADAITAIVNIDGDFSDAIQSGNTAGRSSVLNAFNKVTLLKNTLEGELIPFINGL